MLCLTKVFSSIRPPLARAVTTALVWIKSNQRREKNAWNMTLSVFSGYWERFQITVITGLNIYKSIQSEGTDNVKSANGNHVPGLWWKNIMHTILWQWPENLNSWSLLEFFLRALISQTPPLVYIHHPSLAECFIRVFLFLLLWMFFARFM